MKKPKSPITQIRRSSVKEVLETIQTPEAQSAHHARAFLQRCNLEIVEGEPPLTTLLCIQGPDYVTRALPTTDENRPDYLAWAYAILGTCYSSRNLPLQADNHFQLATSVEDVSDMELAGIMTRHAYHLIYPNWTAAHHLVNQAVDLADNSDDTRRRDDRSLQRCLSIRGLIRAYGADKGESVSHEAAAEDFRNALFDTDPKGDFYTRQTATLGLARMACNSYLSGKRLMPPTQILQIIQKITNQSRARRIPKKSLLDCYCRWTEGLTLFIVDGFVLTRHTLRTLASARRDFVYIGRILPAVELTMDIQWCMIHSEQYADALKEQQFINENLPSLPDAWVYALHQWENNLKARKVEPANSGFIFKTIRGLADVILPEPAPPTPPLVLEPTGW